MQSLVWLVILLACCSGVSLAALIEPKGAPTSSREVRIGHPFRLFGIDYPSGTSLYINSPIGRISVGSSIAGNLPSKSLAASLIQPVELFWDINLTPTPTIYLADISGDLLANMSRLVSENFWQETDFSASSGHLITWENQRSAGLDPANTFQVAIIFGNASTFVLFNYDKMDLTVHLGQSASARMTLAPSGDLILLPFTGSSIGSMVTMSGLADQTVGRFIYRADAWPPVRGGCLSADPSDPTLSTSLVADSVLGGSVAILSGRCPVANFAAVCRLTNMQGGLIAEQGAVRCSRCGSAFLACEMPPALTAGPTFLELKMTVNGATSTFKHQFTIASPDDPSVTRISLNDSMTNWMQLEPASLMISYSPARTANSTLKLQVIGYTEAGLGRLDRAEDLAILTKVLYEGPASSSGSMNLAGKTIRCAAGNADCENYHMGYLRIIDDATPPTKLKSRIVPLGWFVHPYYLDKQQSTWPAAKCKAWHEAKTSPEARRIAVALEQLACPSQLSQALADPGQYMPATYCPSLPGGCESVTASELCLLSRPGVETQIQGVPAAVCCYSQSTGSLIYQEQYKESGTMMVSGSLRSHPNGQLLSRAAGQPLLPGQASYLSTWFWDALPRLHCCSWSPGTGDCQLRFMQARPTPRTSLYVPSRPSLMVGDPHLTSFIGRQFLFNGFGEYWLLQSDRKLAIQARYLLGFITNSASFLTAIAVQPKPGADIVEVLAMPGEPATFSVMYRQTDYTPSQSVSVDLSVGKAPLLMNGITAQLKSSGQLFLQVSDGADFVGIDLRLVTVATNMTYMDMLLTLSPSLKGRTRGLLGQWTDDPTKEFIDIRGKIVPFNSSLAQFDADFCSNNRLSGFNESLFGYSGSINRPLGYSEISSAVSSLKAVFDASSLPSQPQEATVCGANQDCIFDFRVTKNQAVATATANNGRAFNDLRLASEANASTCDVPPLPGLYIDRVLSAGAILTLTCSQPLVAIRAGHTIVCTRLDSGNLTWQPDPTSLGFQCLLPTAQANQANIGLIVGIVVPCVILLLVAIVLIIVFLRRRRDDKPVQATREENKIFLPGNRSTNQPQSGEPIMAKGQPPHQYQAMATSDDGNRRNPRSMPPAQAAAAHSPTGYSGVSSVDSDYKNDGQFLPMPAYHPRSGHTPPPPPQQQQQQQPPVPAQRRSFDRAPRDQVNMQDDQGSYPHQYQQPPPVHQKPKPSKPRPTVSHSEVV